MMVIEKKFRILQIGMVLLTILGLTGFVLAYTNDGTPNYIHGFITINDTRAPSGTNYTVYVTAGTNTGCSYNGSVNDTNVPITRRQIGAYATGDQTCFSTGDNFSVTVPGFSLNITGTFNSEGGNGNLVTYTNLVNLSVYYPENLPPTTTFNSSSTNITPVNSWYNRSVNVTLFPIDNPGIVGSGIFATYYNISGTGQQSGTNFIVSSEGNNTITFYSIDNNGSVENTNTIFMNVDINAPVVTIDTATSPTNATNQTINGTIIENGSGIATINITGALTYTLSGSNFSSLVSLVEGTNTIYVNATDNLSRTGTNNTTILLDTIAPVVTIDPGTILTNATNQTINGTTIETGSGIANITVTNGGPVTLNGSNYSVLVSLEEGLNTIYVNATDNASNRGTNSTTITRDRTAPVVTINTVTSPTNALSQIINGTYIETGSGIASILVNGVNANITGTNYSASVSLLSDGNNTIFVNATDNVSNLGTSNTTIVRDTALPVISSVTNLTPSSVSVTITWNTSEVATSVVKYGTISGSLGQNTSSSTLTTSHSISLTQLQPNTIYYYVVNSTDEAGNSNQSSPENNFTTLDAPAVTIISPIDTTYNSSTISLNASFGGQTVNYTWYKVDSAANSTPSANADYLNTTLSGLTDGAHNVTVYANDSAGLTGQSSVNFTIDTTGPVISSVSNTSATSNSTTITWNTSEAATSVVKYGTSPGNLGQNSSNSTRVTSHSITLTGLLQNTTYYYAVNSTDAWGNSNQSSTGSFITQEVYGSVNGTITDIRLGTTIANAILTLYNASGGTYTATSNANGVYNISNLITNYASPYVYTVSATKTNFTGASSTVTVAASGVTIRDIQMTMFNGTLSGIVIKNGTSIGIGGARVNITNTTLGSIIMTTDASGAYSASLYPAIYFVNVSKTGYLNNNTIATVASNETTTPANSLSSNAVTITANRTAGSADSGQNVSFNLTVVNTGDDTTFIVTNTPTNASTIVTTTPSTLSLGSTTSTGYVVVEVNNSYFGGWPVTITISNSSKSAGVTLTAIMRNASAGYTNESSTVENGSNVTGSTLVNAIVQDNATISGNSTLIMNATVTGGTITDGAVIRGENGNFTINNSIVGNATIVSSNLTGSTIRVNSSVTNSSLTSATVSNSTLTNVTVLTASTISNVVNLSNITLRGVIVTGDPDYEYEGRITGGTGGATYQGINFTTVYASIRISQLVIEQGPNTNVGPGTNFSINDTSLGTSMNFSMIVNLSNPAVINVSETGISPDGTGFSSGTRLGNFLVIRSNDTNISNVTRHVLRLYFDINPSTYTGGVAIYYFNTSAATPAWESLTTTGSGTEGGRYYIEAIPNHFSTFALMGTTTAITTTSTSGGDGGGSGGGGGVVTAEPYDNIVRGELYEKNLVYNIPVLYTFKLPEHGIYEISVTGKETENNIGLKVEALKGPTKIAGISAPQGSVYKNVNIWAGSKRIKEGLIRFKVENTWIENNKITSGDLLMVWWNGKEWIKLETSELKKDDTYAFYEAKTNGFSSFAITAQKGAVVPASAPAVGVTENMGTPAKPAGTATPAPTKKTSGFEAMYVIIGILAVAFVYRRKN